MSKTFRTSRGDLTALHDIDLVLEPGTLTALVGPSGCGKSTLLRIIAGLESADDDRAISIDRMSPESLRRRGEIAIAFQDASLLTWRTAASNVALAQRLARQRVDRTAVNELLGVVGLAGFEKAKPAQMSGGMRQRVAIARCLITSPGCCSWTNHSAPWTNSPVVDSTSSCLRHGLIAGSLRCL